MVPWRFSGASKGRLGICRSKRRRLKILFDQGVPVPLRSRLVGHEVATAYELNWSELKNGELIAAAESAGYELLLTTDQNLKYQQNLSARKIGVIVLLSTSWPRLQKCVAEISAAIGRAKSRSYEELSVR
jgi:hypothetical protein